MRMFRKTFKCSACGAQPITSTHGFGLHLEYSPACENEDATMSECTPGADCAAAFRGRVVEASYEDKVRDHLIDSYTSLEYTSLVSRTTIQSDIKCKLVGGLLDVMKDEITARVAHALPDDNACKAVDSIVHAVFDVHKGIDTEARENTVMRELYSPVDPIKRELVDAPDANGKATGPRRGDFCYDIPNTSRAGQNGGARPGPIAEAQGCSRRVGSGAPTAGSEPNCLL